MTLGSRVHGGPDAAGVPRFDFSTNSNACGPCPLALTAVQQADACHYPDASYARLRQQLADFHGVVPTRVLLAGSASEFIFRVTAWVAQQRLGATDSLAPQASVSLPAHSYGDYAQAAQAWGLVATASPDTAHLVWACEPASPLGGPHTGWPQWLVAPQSPLAGASPLPPPAPLILDCAYEPLRLSGVRSLTQLQQVQVWQLWTPNKALGLTGVRAAYVIAPLGSDAAVAALERLCASWPLGGHGVALLQSWVRPPVQQWLAQSLPMLRDWKIRQVALLQAVGWQCLPSETPFFCARPAQPLDLSRLRAGGIKLRDTASFGLPGYYRLSVQPPPTQDVLAQAIRQLPPAHS
ncbi:MAG: histidinol-phosphate aminotransferase [Rhodoferax sp.]|jgi:histidinol-phosphate aminotransferase